MAHRLPYFVPPLPIAQAPRLEENPYESVPVLGPLHRYSSQNRSSKGTRSNKSGDKYKYLSPQQQQQYGGDYYGLQGQSDITAPLYTQVGGEYSDTYSQPNDRLFGDDKYSQPVYYTNTRDTDQVTAGRLYQGQPDSSFGSDSGYSHHTSGTTGTTGTNGTRGSNSRTNHRRDKHRNSHHSHHSADYIVS